MPKSIPALLTIVAAAASVSAFLASAAPARAEIDYPWCLQISESSGGGTNCGFVNRQQCLASLSGLLGICYENPRYNAAPVPAKRRRAPSR